jgi:broad specificity phosphatase PhoE
LLTVGIFYKYSDEDFLPFNGTLLYSIDIHSNMKQLQYFLFFFVGNVVSNITTAQKPAPLPNTLKLYIVRHAEKDTGKNPLLTEAGNNRAGDLMRILKNKSIKRIYVSEYKRSQNTADSMHLQLGIDTVQYKADTTCTNLFTTIERHQDWGNTILIITHSNILPTIIYKMGVTSFPQQNVPEQEFDNLYFIRIKKHKPKLQHTKYGQPSTVSAAMQRMK